MNVYCGLGFRNREKVFYFFFFWKEFVDFFYGFVNVEKIIGYCGIVVFIFFIFDGESV